MVSIVSYDGPSGGAGGGARGGASGRSGYGGGHSGGGSGGSDYSYVTVDYGSIAGRLGCSAASAGTWWRRTGWGSTNSGLQAIVPWPHSSLSPPRLSPCLVVLCRCHCGAGHRSRCRQLRWWLRQWLWPAAAAAAASFGSSVWLCPAAGAAAAAWARVWSAAGRRLRWGQPDGRCDSTPGGRACAASLWCTPGGCPRIDCPHAHVGLICCGAEASRPYRSLSMCRPPSRASLATRGKCTTLVRLFARALGDNLACCPAWEGRQGIAASGRGNTTPVPGCNPAPLMAC